MVVSHDHDLFAYNVQTNQTRLLSGVKVTVDGIPHSLPELVPGIGFGKDGMA
jgi:hypothetical protein